VSAVAPQRRPGALFSNAPAVNPRALAAEFTGTAFLLVAVVGSGIMAERLLGGDIGLALFANAIATGSALVALILAVGTVSGAHFNPAVTLADAWQGGLPWRAVPGYACAQVAGAVRRPIIVQRQPRGRRRANARGPRCDRRRVRIWCAEVAAV
jgi:major intrinsic protein